MSHDLMVEQAVYTEEVQSLEAVADGEDVGYDQGARPKLEDPNNPGTAQYEQLGQSLKCQKTVGEKAMYIR